MICERCSRSLGKAAHCPSCDPEHLEERLEYRKRMARTVQGWNEEGLIRQDVFRKLSIQLAGELQELQIFKSRQARKTADQQSIVTDQKSIATDQQSESIGQRSAIASEPPVRPAQDVAWNLESKPSLHTLVEAPAELPTPPVLAPEAPAKPSAHLAPEVPVVRTPPKPALPPAKLFPLPKVPPQLSAISVVSRLVRERAGWVVGVVLTVVGSFYLAGTLWSGFSELARQLVVLVGLGIWGHIFATLGLWLKSRKDETLAAGQWLCGVAAALVPVLGVAAGAMVPGGLGLVGGGLFVLLGGSLLYRAVKGVDASSDLRFNVLYFLLSCGVMGASIWGENGGLWRLVLIALGGLATWAAVAPARGLPAGRLALVGGAGGLGLLLCKGSLAGWGPVLEGAALLGLYVDAAASRWAGIYGRKTSGLRGALVITLGLLGGLIGLLNLGSGSLDQLGTVGGLGLLLLCAGLGWARPLFGGLVVGCGVWFLGELGAQVSVHSLAVTGVLWVGWSAGIRQIAQYLQSTPIRIRESLADSLIGGAAVASVLGLAAAHSDSVEAGFLLVLLVGAVWWREKRFWELAEKAMPFPWILACLGVVDAGWALGGLQGLLVGVLGLLGVGFWGAKREETQAVSSRVVAVFTPLLAVGGAVEGSIGLGLLGTGLVLWGVGRSVALLLLGVIVGWAGIGVLLWDAQVELEAWGYSLGAGTLALVGLAGVWDRRLVTPDWRKVMEETPRAFALHSVAHLLGVATFLVALELDQPHRTVLRLLVGLVGVRWLWLIRSPVYGFLLSAGAAVSVVRPALRHGYPLEEALFVAAAISVVVLGIATAAGRRLEWLQNALKKPAEFVVTLCLLALWGGLGWSGMQSSLQLGMALVAMGGLLIRGTFSSRRASYEEAALWGGLVLLLEAGWHRSELTSILPIFYGMFALVPPALLVRRQTTLVLVVAAIGQGLYLGALGEGYFLLAGASAGFSLVALHTEQSQPWLDAAIIGGITVGLLGAIKFLNPSPDLLLWGGLGMMLLLLGGKRLPAGVPVLGRVGVSMGRVGEAGAVLVGMLGSSWICLDIAELSWSRVGWVGALLGVLLLGGQGLLARLSLLLMLELGAIQAGMPLYAGVLLVFLLGQARLWPLPAQQPLFSLVGALAAGTLLISPVQESLVPTELLWLLLGLVVGWAGEQRQAGYLIGLGGALVVAGTPAGLLWVVGSLMLALVGLQQEQKSSLGAGIALGVLGIHAIVLGWLNLGLVCLGAGFLVGSNRLPIEEVKGLRGLVALGLAFSSFFAAGFEGPSPLALGGAALWLALQFESEEREKRFVVGLGLLAAGVGLLVPFGSALVPFAWAFPLLVAGLALVPVPGVGAVPELVVVGVAGALVAGGSSGESVRCGLQLGVLSIPAWRYSREAGLLVVIMAVGAGLQPFWEQGGLVATGALAILAAGFLKEERLGLLARGLVGLGLLPVIRELNGPEPLVALLGAGVFEGLLGVKEEREDRWNWAGGWLVLALGLGWWQELLSGELVLVATGVLSVGYELLSRWVSSAAVLRKQAPVVTLLGFGIGIASEDYVLAPLASGVVFLIRYLFVPVTWELVLGAVLLDIGVAARMVESRVGDPALYTSLCSLSAMVVAQRLRGRVDANAVSLTRYLAGGALFLTLFGQQLVDPERALVLLLAAVGMLGLGALMRVRAFLFLGAGGALAGVITQVVRFGWEHSSFWALYLTVLGVGILAVMVLSSVYRRQLEEARARFGARMREWE